MEAIANSEKTFYEDGHVTVTQTRYITGSRTYAVRNISSVYIFKIEANRTLPALVFLIGLFVFFASDDFRPFGFLVALAGLAWFFMLRNRFAVRISTNAGETNSKISKNEEYIEGIVAAINAAIIHTG